MSIFFHKVWFGLPLDYSFQFSSTRLFYFGGWLFLCDRSNVSSFFSGVGAGLDRRFIPWHLLKFCSSSINFWDHPINFINDSCRMLSPRSLKYKLYDLFFSFCSSLTKLLRIFYYWIQLLEVGCNSLIGPYWKNWLPTFKEITINKGKQHRSAQTIDRDGVFLIDVENIFSYIHQGKITCKLDPSKLSLLQN